MKKEHRRAARFNVSMAVTLILRDTKNGLALAEPVPGTLRNISLYGANLSVPRIRTGNSHLFYACSDDPDKVIFLEVLAGEEEERLVLPARPVWFDHVVADQGNHFAIGMEFLVPPEDPGIVRLFTFLAGRFPPAGGWLKRLFRLA